MLIKENIVKNSNEKENVTIIPRKQHSISRNNISKNALKVLYRLNNADYDAYLVGGGVRDLLLGKTTKDFDIVTNATPNQIRKLFRNCRLVGRRFRLAHIVFDQEIIEVATFRGHHAHNLTDQNVFQKDQNGMLLRDNIFGSIEEDARRRDFTINSLYYNIKDFTVRDYVGGIQDLKSGLIRLIGRPEIRYREDPVRMLRAIRFSAKLNMRISQETSESILHLAPLINDVSPARLFEETLKLLQTGYGFKSYTLLRRYNLFQLLFPSITPYINNKNNNPMEKIIVQMLENTDERVKNKMHVNPVFMFATILWYPLLDTTHHLTQTQKLTQYDKFLLASNNILEQASRTLAIPKRINISIRSLWQLQQHISHPKNKLRNKKFIKNPTFQEAYNLLTLRAKIEQNYKLKKLAKWWKTFQISNLEI